MGPPSRPAKLARAGAGPVAGVPGGGTGGERAPLPALRRRILVTGLLLLAAGVVLTVLVAASGTRPAVQRVDDGWYRWMVAGRSPLLVTVSKMLSTAFSTAVDWPLRVAVTIVIAWRRRWLALAAWAVTVVLSESTIGVAKGLVDRGRPPAALIATSGASFPSGHAIASAVTAIGIVMALASGRRRLQWMVPAVALAMLVALSRTYLSAHWLSDVVAGACIGGGIALAVPEAFEVARDGRQARRAAAGPTGGPADVTGGPRRRWPERRAGG